MLQIDSIENTVERFGPAFIELEEGIPCEKDDAGMHWAVASVRLSCPDVASGESFWSETAKRLTQGQEIVFVEPPLLVDEDGESLPDGAISGVPEQRALVSCWVPAPLELAA